MLRFALHLCASLIGIPLEVLVIAAMLRGPYRRYPALFVYMIAVFVVSLVETPLYVVGYLAGLWHADRHMWQQYLKCYWIDDRVLMGLVFVVVLSLVYQATERAPARRVLRTGMVCGAVIFSAIAFWVHYDPAVATGQWMTAWTSNLYFGAAILDLGLWAMLIGARAKDIRLLMFSGGLGILFAGMAIGLSISNLSVARHSTAIALAGGVVEMLSDLTFLYIWWQALRVRETALQHP